MKIAIYGRAFGDEYSPYIQKLFDKLVKISAEISVFEPFYEYLSPKINLPECGVFKSNGDVRQNDFVFSIGGDGTFLEATALVRDSEVPIMGINTGRLGFLSSVGIDETEQAVDSIVQKKYKLDKRTLLKLETDNNLFGSENYALNELTIHRKDTASMVTIHAYLDGNFLNSYWADGLIVATPTGSTAYSMSCGGPIVLPGSGNFVINPVAPHNLTARPIVVPDDSKITLRVEGRSDAFLVSLDSHTETIDSETELSIIKNDFHINLLRLESHSYLDTIRNKLNWGLDIRERGKKN
ncbi:MAG: NAD kinase [Flavobacteriales bacterium]|nr:MAG: NAD kinase [Flavobacteriales bacterium]